MRENTIKRRKIITHCPICSSESFNIRFKYPSNKKIISCLKCSHMYARPRLKFKFLKEIYSSKKYFVNPNERAFFNNYPKEEWRKEKFSWIFNRFFEFVKPVKGEQIKILDIGCAVGFAILAAKELGFECEGIDISKWAINYATKKYQLNVKECSVKDLSSDPNYHNKFDIILMFDIIEHLTDPITNLQAAHKLLIDKGFLLITTPNLESICARLFGRRYEPLDPDLHLHYFTRNSLLLTLKKSGFTPIKTLLLPDYPISGKITKYLHLIFHLFFAKILNRIAFRLPQKLMYYILPYTVSPRFKDNEILIITRKIHNISFPKNKRE